MWILNRHCEERSDVAIQKIIKKMLRIFNWIASSKFSIFPRNDESTQE
ncbi:hypothetical protein [Rickettsia felis]|nr:hypothetical protein [Rickettsia felis]